MTTQLAVALLENEYWWGGAAHYGYLMPIHGTGEWLIDPASHHAADQSAPVYLSSKGRYLWSERPFTLRAAGGKLLAEGLGKIELGAGHGTPGYATLKGAYQAVSKHFPFSPRVPDRRFFSQPQYNTWIELCTHQTTEGILNYARGILAHGLPAGILMVDEGWAEDYGVFEFNRRKIPDAKGLIDTLHGMGFSVMLWVTPNIACAGPRFQELKKKGYLVRDSGGKVAIREWWNGHSAVLDLTNPQASAWYQGELDRLMEEYGADGFKFDAGDSYFYHPDDQTFAPVPPLEHTRLYNALGERYALNEFRAAWAFGGHAIVARLQDKFHAWRHFGIDTLIPHTIQQGLMGYAYCCPDMVGGGSIDSFGKDRALDQELFVRWAQASACMGMMQMSIAPWRVLDADHAVLVQEAMALHQELGERIWALARHAAKTGEPIVRHMAYEFPEEGLELVNDQFMLGSELLVAPVITPGCAERSVRLPKGKWQSWRGEIFDGGQTLRLPVTLRDIPRFNRLHTTVR